MKNDFSYALTQAKEGKFVKRKVIKNSTVIIVYKKRLYQMCRETGIRYPFSPTNKDLFATDWIIVE